MSDDAILAAWVDAFTLASNEATNGRLALLRGDEWSAYDARGLHVYSAACGEMAALTALLPGVLGDERIAVHPADLRRACLERAAELHEAERYRDWRTRFLLERKVPAEASA